jgi:hypothetical protein
VRMSLDDLGDTVSQAQNAHWLRQAAGPRAE